MALSGGGFEYQPPIYSYLPISVSVRIYEEQNNCTTFCTRIKDNKIPVNTKDGDFSFIFNYTFHFGTHCVNGKFESHVLTVQIMKPSSTNLPRLKVYKLLLT